MFSTPDFWVFIAFVLFILFFGKRIIQVATKIIDQHTLKITNQLEEAERLQNEALSLLNSYKKKHEEAHLQAREILFLAEKEASEFKKLSEIEFEKLLAQKEKNLLERIAMETEETKNQLRSQVAREAVAIVEAVLSYDSKERKELTKAALKEVIKLGSSDIKLS